MRNILYIEHSKDRHAFISALEKLPAYVRSLTDPNEDDLRLILAKQRYDLVITDAFFLKEDEDHKGGTQDGIYKLGDIVRQVRSVDNKRVIIAALTEFSPSLLVEHQDDLSRVDFLWEKVAGPDFLYWQVRRILQESKRGLPEYLLVERLIDMISSREDKGIPWRNTMTGMLEAYRSANLEAQQVKEVKGYMRAIASEYECEGFFDVVFEKLEQAEPMNVVASPLSWGHLRHCINVFWVGYYLLNSGLFDLERIGKQIFGHKKGYNVKDYVKMVNGAWFLGSIFHDIGLLGQGIFKLCKSCNEILSIYKIPNFSLSIAHVCPEFMKNAKGQNLKVELATMIGRDLTDLFNWAFEKNGLNFDHGFLSAFTILDIFANEGPYRMCGEAAAIAAAMHNVFTIFSTLSG